MVAKFLTADAQADLVALAQLGNIPAQQQLVLQFLPFITATVMQNYHDDIEDHIQDGVLAVYRALETYSPEFNASFATYLKFWVRSVTRQAINKRLKAQRLVQRVKTRTEVYIDPVNIARSDAMYAFIRKNRLLFTLREYEIAILTIHLGFKGPELHKEMGISRQRQWQLMQAVIKKLQKHVVEWDPEYEE